ncbi:MAG: PRC-barrel domain-containing protein [Candidatus Limnocylindrales bacterium]
MTVEKTTVHDDDVEREPTLEKLHDLGETVSSSDEDIRGRMVKDKDGRDLGTIDGLLVDAAAGKVRYMEVASGCFLGFGERKSLIPVEAITKITEHEVSISHTLEHVAGAPPYDPSLVATDAHYFTDLYPYYGYEGGVVGVVPSLVGYPSARGDPLSPEVGLPHHA